MRKLFFLFVLGLPLLAAAQETRKITGPGIGFVVRTIFTGSNCFYRSECT